MASSVRVVAIVQARMGSSRLPGKVLADVQGKPMLRWLLDRVMVVKEIDEVVVATTTNPEDDVLEEWLNDNEVFCFRGSEGDVLGRFYHCAQDWSPDLVVRITADDPLKDPGLISRAISFILADKTIDYCSNTLAPTYPEGLDIEVFRYTALVRAYCNATLLSEREHVTPYIWKHPDKFKLYGFRYEIDLSCWRWTVDNSLDLDFIRAIYGYFINEPLVSFEKVIDYIRENPDLLEINGSTIRNEGYIKSLKMEGA